MLPGMSDTLGICCKIQVVLYCISVSEEDKRMNTVPNVELGRCDYDRKRKVLKLASEIFSGRFPRKFVVRSHHTGRQIEFTVVGENDPLFDQDCWDGEMCIYRPVGQVPNVDYLVVHHQW